MVSIKGPFLRFARCVGKLSGISSNWSNRDCTTGPLQYASINSFFSTCSNYYINIWYALKNNELFLIKFLSLDYILENNGNKLNFSGSSERGLVSASQRALGFGRSAVSNYAKSSKSTNRYEFSFFFLRLYQ